MLLLRSDGGIPKPFYNLGLFKKLPKTEADDPSNQNSLHPN